MRVRDAVPIDDYLRTLGAALHGPSRLKAELLAEARGGLEDAADAYTLSGLDPRAAQRRAAGRRRAVDPRAIVRPLAVVALAASAVIWSVGTFAAVTAVVESPRALTWPPMIAAWVLLNTVFGLLARCAVRAITAARWRAAAG